MLEPILRPGPAIAMYVVTAVLAIVGMIFSFSFGTVQVALALPLLVVFCVIRIAGIARGRRDRLTMMPWGHRLVSWGALLLPFAISGAILNFLFAIPLGVFILADVAGALSKRRPGDAEDAPKRARSDWRRKAKGPLLVAILIGAFVAFHIFFAMHQTWTALADWGAVTVLVAIYLRFALVAGKRAKDHAARPPVTHRLHAAREETIRDPARAGVERGLEEFLRDGNVETLTWSARSIAASRGFTEVEAQALEAQLVELVTRPRTGRELDLVDAIEFLEAAAIAPPGDIFRADTPRGDEVSH